MANIKCIDVSEWQGTVEWKKVKSAGYSYAIIRAGFGRESAQKDKEFEKNYKNAKAAGIGLGVYWYSYATDVADARKEAKACISVLKGKTFELPVFYDMEDSTMIKLGKATLTQIAKEFCDYVIKSGLKAGVYSNPNWFNNYLDYKEIRKRYPVWLAQYYKEPQYDCDVWQYTSKGKVVGVSGDVDINYIINENIVESKNNNASAKGYESALLQALLRQAYAQGLCRTFVKPIDNKMGNLTNAAIIECRESLGYKNPDSTIDMDFVTELEHQINILRIDKEKNLKAQIKEMQMKPAGDFNGDGVVNIKDATDIQKHLADID